MSPIGFRNLHYSQELNIGIRTPVPGFIKVTIFSITFLAHFNNVLTLSRVEKKDFKEIHPFQRFNSKFKAPSRKLGPCNLQFPPFLSLQMLIPNWVKIGAEQ